MIPYSDTEKIALLAELERGDKVIIPNDIDHAKFMLKVAQTYIDDHKQRVIGYLKDDTNKTQSR